MDQPEKYGGTEKKISYRKIVYPLVVSAVVIIALLALTGDSIDLSLFMKLSHLWLIGGFAIFILAQSLNALRTVLLLKAFGVKLPFREAFANILLMHFFNNLTPFAAGGQPFQIYDLAKRGIPVATSAAVIVSRYVMTNIAVVTLAFCFMPRYWRLFFNIPGIGVLAFVGALATFFLLILLITLSYSKKFLMKLVDLLVKPKFLKRLLGKALKCHSDEVRESLIEKFEEFHLYMKLIWKKGPHYMIVDVVLAMVYSAATKYILYFVLTGLSKTSGIALNTGFTGVWGAEELLYLIAFYMPTPGASGALEGGLYFMLKGSIPKELVAIGIAVWRFMTYHLVIILGSLLFIGVTTRRKKRKLCTQESK